VLGNEVFDRPFPGMARTQYPHVEVTLQVAREGPGTSVGTVSTAFSSTHTARSKPDPSRYN